MLVSAIRTGLLAAILLLVVLPIAQAVWCAEIDTTGKVASVHDGDTFTLMSGDKVRLADLNAPELGEDGADEATDYLTALVDGKTVYLDVDDRYQTDPFGRLVCVVYVEHNSTHYLNVNKALIAGGFAEARNYDNEFNYNTFELYWQQNQPTQPDPENGSFGLLGLVLVLIVGALMCVALIKRRR